MVEETKQHGVRKGIKDLYKDSGQLTRQAYRSLADRLSALIPPDIENKVLSRGYATGNNTVLDLPYLYYAGKRNLRNLRANRERYEVDKLRVEIAKLKAEEQQRKEIKELEEEKKRLEEELARLRG